MNFIVMMTKRMLLRSDLILKILECFNATSISSRVDHLTKNEFDQPNQHHSFLQKSSSKIKKINKSKTAV